MPFLQSISQDFLAKSLGRKRATLLGGEASIDANFLYIDFKNTGSSTLQVFGNTPIPADYVIVGGGGGGGWPGYISMSNPNCYYDTYLHECSYYAGTCGSGSWIFYGYWAGSNYIGFALNDYGCSKPTFRTNLDGGGGGAGGVLTGSINLTSQNYPITVGAGGVAGSWNAATNSGTNPTNGANTTALGLTAFGGGYGAYGLSAKANSGGSGGGAGGQQPGGNGTTGQGNHGSFRMDPGSSGNTEFNVDINYNRVNLCMYGMCGVQYGLYKLIVAWEWWRATPFRGRLLTDAGWGGGAGAPGQWPDFQPGSAQANASGTSGPLYACQGYYWSYPTTANTSGRYWDTRPARDPRVSSYSTPAALNSYAWAPEPDPVKGFNAYSYVETVGATGQEARMSIWSNVRWGIGVNALGLNVGGGGMTGIHARDLANSFGGGYPVAGTTGQGTYSKDGSPNTGGGGAGGIRLFGTDVGTGGAGGSGIVRLRIKRSDLGI